MPLRSPLNRQRAIWALLALSALLCFFAGLGGYPLFDLDEGAFSEATREMFERGDFIATYLNGEPRFDKPILIYWLQAIAVALLGVTEWAFRLPSAVAATLWAAGILVFARRYVDRDSAWTAPLFMMTTLVVIVIGRAATADALLNLWLALTLLDIYRYYTTPSRAVALRVYLWMGLGFLTKGPVAVALPLLVSAAFYVWSGHWRRLLAAVFYPPGWAVFLAVALPWYALIYLDQGQAFIDGFFLKHNIGRFSDTMEQHGGSVLYYVGLLPLVLLPHTGLFLRLLPMLASLRRGTLDQFLWIWFGVVFLLFSFSQTQLPHYILYGCTPLFLLMARYRERLRSRWLAYVPVVFIFALLAALPELVALAQPYTPAAYESALLERATGAFGTAYRVWTLGGLAVALILPFLRGLAPWQGLIAAGLIQALVVMQAVVPALAYIQQQPVVEAARFARGLDANVVGYRFRMPSFSVYRGAVTPEREPRPGEVVVTRVGKLEDLGPHAVIFRRGGVVMARMKETTPGDAE
ncbi:glycosyltransferase family 39 protein [Ectothiorhodospiraceae bacterium WFHF3C12]|nr:glycosyltransferase family 39 protein [Ectothiorhodospiraceae bacterium WFHF3C12]